MSGESPGTTELQLKSVPAPCDEPSASSPRGFPDCGQWVWCLNLATLNVRGLRDSSKCARLLAELKNIRVDVAAVQETHFIFYADCRVLEGGFNVFSAYDSRTSIGVSLLVGRSLDADVVFAGDGGRLVVADVYAPNNVAARVSFFFVVAR